MNTKIPSGLKIVEMPEAVKLIKTGSTTEARNIKIASALKHMRPGEAVEFTSSEWKEFGRCAKMTTLKYLRNAGFKAPYIEEQDDKVYIFNRGEV